MRLTIDNASSLTSHNNARCIASDETSIYVVWSDNRDGNSEIYFKKSSDGGITWGTDTRLTFDASASEFPSVTLFDSLIHIVWQDTRDGNQEIYYKRSSDGGMNWSSDMRLSIGADYSSFPSISVSGLDVRVIWQDKRDDYYWELYYKYSSNGGLNWGADFRLTNIIGHDEHALIVSSGLNVNVLSMRGWYVWNIYQIRSTDGGTNWGTYLDLTSSLAPCCSYGALYPSASISGSIIHLAWTDNYRDGNPEIYYKRSKDAGLSWGPDIRLTYSSSNSMLPSVSASGSVVHISWFDSRDGNDEIYYKRSLDNGDSWSNDMRMTNNSASSVNGSSSASGSRVNILWQDERDGNYEIYFKQDSTGNPHSIDINLIVEGLYNSSNDLMNIKDTVKAFLRNSISPYLISDSAVSVIDSVTMKGNFFFNNAASGNYYIIIKYRNGIETWSRFGGEFYEKGKTSFYSFIDSVSNSFGDNMKQIDNSPVRFGIFSGDVNQDGFIDISDGSLINNDLFNFVTGYVPSDLNGDDIIDVADAVFADNNGFNFVSKITP